MNELEHDGIGSEPTPAKTHDAEVLPDPPVTPRASGSSSSDDPSAGASTVAAAVDESELEPPPVWDDPNDPPLVVPEQSDDAWAFLQDTADAIDEPLAPHPRRRDSASAAALERILTQGLFRADLEPLLVAVERALRAKTAPQKSTSELLRLVSRARAAHAPEPGLMEAVLRARSTGRISDDCGLLSALIARRLALPSVRAERKSVEPSAKRRLLRELQALVSRVSRTHGDRGLRELARSSARLGASARERGRSLTELVPLLARRIERERAASTRPSFEIESRGSSRTRRIRLPGRVEIVIYEE